MFKGQDGMPCCRYCVDDQPHRGFQVSLGGGLEPSLDGNLDGNLDEKSVSPQREEDKRKKRSPGAPSTVQMTHMEALEKARQEAVQERIALEMKYKGRKASNGGFGATPLKESSTYEHSPLGYTSKPQTKMAQVRQAAGSPRPTPPSPPHVLREETYSSPPTMHPSPGTRLEGSSEGLREVLEELGLIKYLALLEREEVALRDIPHLSKEDLRAIGLPMGPATRLIQYFAESY